MYTDWLLLSILGISTALISIIVDDTSNWMQKFQTRLMEMSESGESRILGYAGPYACWTLFSIFSVMVSALFARYLSPQSIGSGIPEMKTILRGASVKHYLSIPTLISTVVGITLSLGSGIPIGKLGSFVRIAANVANLLSNIANRFDGAYANESKKAEMMAAACATGVASAFSAPIGGVLLSIELTSMYFSIHNYWRCFFVAACGATVFRILRVVALEAEETLVALYQTRLPPNAFVPRELFFFALIGLMCGLIAAVYIGL